MKTPSVLDQEVLQRLSASIGAGGIAEVLRVYIGEIGGDVDALEKACARGDLSMVAFHAHRLKGGSSAVGAEVMQMLATAAEAAARLGHADVVQLLVPRFAPASHQVRVEAARIAFGSPVRR